MLSSKAQNGKSSAARCRNIAKISTSSGIDRLQTFSAVPNSVSDFAHHLAHSFYNGLFPVNRPI